MIIWRGYGFVVPICIGVGFFGTQKLAEIALGTPLQPDMETLSSILGMAVAALTLFVVDIILIQPRSSQIALDKKTGEYVTYVRKHDCYFIPVKYWPYIIAALGIWDALRS